MGLAHQGIQGRGEAERDAESEAVPAELRGGSENLGCRFLYYSNIGILHHQRINTSRK